MQLPTEPPSRVNYFAGRLLTPEDLAHEQQAVRDKQWLHNRLLHGDGVAKGLTVTVEHDTVHVAPGLAIDRLGREILLTEQLSIDASSVSPDSHGRVQVVIAWAEEPAGEVTGPDGPMPSRYVERPHLLLADHTLEEAPEHAVPLARLHRRGDELVADSSIRRHLHQHLHHDV